ncbi:MAG: SH3 domain-containing protein [Clostridia bacterium]|nr:SH3 domain-containing protein [Clostridia bacterium]
MKRVWKMLISVLLVLLLCVPAMAAAEEAVYGVCLDDNVNVRKTAGAEGALWFKVNQGHVAEITGEKKVGDDLWYRIRTGHPTPNGRTYVGYILSDFFRVMTAEETKDYLGSQTTPAPEAALRLIQRTTDDALAEEDHEEYSGVAVVGAKGKITTKANFRSQPSTTAGAILGTIEVGTEVDVNAVPAEGDANGWYRITYNGKTGYVFSDLLELTDPGTEPTPDPGYGTEVTDTWGEVTTDKVNFRTEPRKDGNNANVIQKLNTGDEVEILTVPDKVSTSDWYRVRYNGTVGYIQSNFIRITKGGLIEDTNPDNENVKATGVITADGVNFRTGAGTGFASMGKLNEGTVVELRTIPSVIDTKHWYKVYYNGTTGYIQAPFIRVLTLSEDALPDVSEYGYARLIEDSANLRNGPGGLTATQWKGKGTMMRIVGEKENQGVYDWYPVYHSATSTIYYVRDDMIEVVLVKDGELVTPGPTQSTYGYIITTKKGVNLRIQPFADSVAQVPKNTVLACVGPSVVPEENDTYTWYKVRYSGMVGYLRGDCVRVCTSTGGYIEDEELTPTPGPTEDTGSTVYGYIKLVKDNVNLRVKPLGASQGWLPLNLVLPMIGNVTPEGEYGKYCWYHVKTADGRTGYIRGDCAEICEEGGEEVTPTPTPTPTATDMVTSGATGRLLKNTNFRKEPKGGYNIITVIPADTVVEILTIPADRTNGWYKIRYSGQTGYVMAYLMELINAGSEPTAAPTLSAFGYVMINDTGVNLRNEPNGTQVYKQLDKGTVWPMVGLQTTDANKVVWYPINADGQVGYVHGGYSFKLSPEQEESYLAGNGVPENTPAPETPDTTLTDYVITTADKVNLRSSYSLESARKYQVPLGTVMYCSETKDVGTVTWYHVVYDNQEVWVHGAYVKFMTQAEFNAWIASDPDVVPDKESHLGYLKLIMDNVYIRNAAAGTTIVDQLRLGTVIRYYTNPIEDSAGKYTWYRVLTPSGDFGYIRSDMVEKCDADGKPLPTPTPNLGDLSSAPEMQQESSYTTLKLGSKGIRVTNLVNELINQGYYTGSTTDSFTTQVQTAVKLFQQVKGLKVDGIAGEATQHALFGTVKVGAGDTSNLEFSIYPVEKIDWFEGGIQELIPRGANFKVYDVKTGIVWWAHRWAGAYHADIETLTAADSKRLCEIYGVKNLQQIVDDNKWERRPCLITIGTRTFAASLDGMQHGTDTIPNNGMDGQICLHFTNSLGHSSEAVSTSHKEAIEYAYNHCPAGKK